MNVTSFRKSPTARCLKSMLLPYSNRSGKQFTVITNRQALRLRYNRQAGRPSSLLSFLMPDHTQNFSNLLGDFRNIVENDERKSLATNCEHSPVRRGGFWTPC